MFFPCVEPSLTLSQANKRPSHPVNAPYPLRLSPGESALQGVFPFRTSIPRDLKIVPRSDCCGSYGPFPRAVRWQPLKRQLLTQTALWLKFSSTIDAKMPPSVDEQQRNIRCHVKDFLGDTSQKIILYTGQPPSAQHHQVISRPGLFNDVFGVAIFFVFNFYGDQLLLKTYICCKKLRSCFALTRYRAFLSSTRSET